jgi:hypothetical protein
LGKKEGAGRGWGRKGRTGMGRRTCSHRQQTGFVVLENKVLIIERLQSIDTSRSRAITIEEVTSLAHEILNLSPTNISISSHQNRKSNNIGHSTNRFTDKGNGAKGTYDSMEFTPFIPLWSPQMILCLARTKLSEVLGRLGYYISEEFELDAAQWFACHNTC